ncbi:hypothetical protein HBI56_052670 [Parastagonospora nodorum]|uniref:Zn(2)-C6 fungal-type domain-containing protein n=2 Tax=Phaeosphaeria nodorum (strain SN15 / ATCC MYA-4574 / FGSC 10173) TaxID=321614 RepID=A0A7U2NR98_PHANO|nr:hypothetical protein HBH56_099480 [Parastagonospora nodorum]QRD07453.1 hypothetical protein JI435_131540 [Parastagonospora nodorum SN15]KAH3930415.1 hypothetical protein HBH54_113800 [Parastagonospora nodorum]KAH3942851.1 hypothetical protein HBH53_182170 [Parastagonospora nodorum]KAH3964657.1 hypothetical protein HBH51_158280 [Parastagonospora nodorum]
MAPKSQRSRGCAQCRERRVKCDETPEFCNECRRLGLACSGPSFGAIVIDMTERSKTRGRKKKESTRAAVTIRGKADNDTAQAPKTTLPRIELHRKTKAVDMPVPNPMFPVERRYTEDVERAVTAIRYQYRPPTFYQPTKVHPEALDNAFLSHYVQLNSGTKSYSPEIQWLSHLPRIHANATKPAVKLSLRAVSMAFYAKLHHDPSILIDSWRWYTVGLSAQRQSISRIKGDQIPEESEVLVPLILALYETYCGTTATGAMIHLAAAARLMNMRGPHNCKTGIIWPLFKGIRNAEARRGIVFGKTSIYASPEWMTIPFIGMPRDAHQQLADIELMIPVAMQKLQFEGSLRSFFSTPLAPGIDVEPCRELTNKLMADLVNWAAMYPNLTQITKDSKDVYEVGDRSGHGLDISNEALATAPLPDTFIALLASNYVSTKLILNMMLYKMGTQALPLMPPAAAAEHFDIATHCAKAILRGFSNMEKAQTAGFDLLRSISPLITVISAGPGVEQFREAGEMLQRLAMRIGGLQSILQSHFPSPSQSKQVL